MQAMSPSRQRRPCEDDDGHFERLPSSNFHGVGEEDEYHAAADAEADTPFYLAAPHRNSSPEVYTDRAIFVPGRPYHETADIEIKRRVRLARVCFDQFKLELYGMETASFTLKVRMLKSEVMESLMYGCVTSTLVVVHFTVLHSAHVKPLLRIIISHRRQRTDPLSRMPRPSRRHNARALRRLSTNCVQTMCVWRLSSM